MYIPPDERNSKPTKTKPQQQTHDDRMAAREWGTTRGIPLNAQIEEASAKQMAARVAAEAAKTQAQRNEELWAKMSTEQRDVVQIMKLIRRGEPLLQSLTWRYQRGYLIALRRFDSGAYYWSLGPIGLALLPIIQRPEIFAHAHAGGGYDIAAHLIGIKSPTARRITECDDTKPDPDGTTPIKRVLESLQKRLPLEYVVNA